MSIAINSNFERDQYQAVAAQTVFPFSFPIFSETYIKVYQRAGNAPPNDALDLLTLGVDYSVTGVGQEAGGFITLTAPATVNDIVTLVGEEPIERESVFTDYNPFTVALNQQLNEQTVMAQQTYTYWNHVTPRYYFSELVSDDVRPLKRYLPMLNDGDIWIGRGNLGDNPDDITTINVVDFASLGILSAFYILGDSNPLLTDAQDLNSLVEGILYTTPNAGGSGQGLLSVLNVGTGLNLDLVTNTLNATGSNQEFITQIGHGFAVGNWIRIDQTSLEAELAIATTAEFAEIYGLVVSVPDANTFLVQSEGQIDTGIFAGMTIGGVYFLSSTTPGAMTLSEPIIPGEISLPLFIARTATRGTIRHSRGKVVN